MIPKYTLISTEKLTHRQQMRRNKYKSFTINWLILIKTCAKTYYVTINRIVSLGIFPPQNLNEKISHKCQQNTEARNKFTGQPTA